MSESKQVFIFGYAGHAYVIIESLLEAGYSIAGYFDYQEAEKNPYGLKYLGFEQQVEVKSIVQDHGVFPAVGDNRIREKLVHFFDQWQLRQFTLIDPSARVSRTALVGVSTYVGKNAVINAQATVGRGAIINTQAVVEHECVVEDFAHLAPGAILCGQVQVGTRTFVGAQAVVRQNIEIASDVLIGAGSVVIQSIQEIGTWAGNPSKKW